MSLVHQYTFDTADFTEFDERVMVNPPSSIYLAPQAAHDGSCGARTVSTDCQKAAYAHDYWDSGLSTMVLRFWFKHRVGTDEGDWAYVMCWEDVDNNRIGGIYVIKDGGVNKVFYDDSGSGGVILSPWISGQWYHVQVYRDTIGGAIKVYIDRVLAAEGTCSTDAQGIYAGLYSGTETGIEFDIDTIDVGDSESDILLPVTYAHSIIGGRNNHDGIFGRVVRG